MDGGKDGWMCIMYMYVIVYTYIQKQNRWKMVSINPGVIYGPTLSGKEQRRKADDL